MVGAALVEAMKVALSAGDPAAAELVACECVVLAETKDHADWQLIGQVRRAPEGQRRRGACRKPYDQSRTRKTSTSTTRKGWCRELWVQSLGLTAVLPPPEERQHVKTAIGAARAEQSAEKQR